MPRPISRSARDVIFALLSAVLVVLPYHFDILAPLTFIAFVPLFFALSGLSPSEAFRISYIFGVVFYLLLGYWLTYVSVAGFLVLAAYLALYPALFGFFAVYFLDSNGPFIRKTVLSVFFIASFWVIAEVVRGWMITGLPWALLAYTQWKNLVVIQMADLTGAWGVSFFLVAVNVLIFKMLKVTVSQPHPDWKVLEYTKAKALTILGITLAILAGSVVLYGMLQLNTREAFYKSEAPKAQMHVSVLQGNIPQEEKWDARIKGIIFEKYKRLTLMSALEHSDLIVWPETSFPGYLEDEPIMSTHLRGVVRQSRTNVLVGAPSLGNIAEGEISFHNSALLYGPDGEERQRYSKLHLVPFGEYIPFEGIFGILRNFVTIGHFSPGAERTIFEVGTRYQQPNFKAKFGVLICFEDIFPGLVRGFAKDGADFLINITNDAWFGKTSAPYQHAAASVFRAVENRLPVVRAANTGLSGFITAEGRLVSTVSDDGKEIFVTGHKGEDIILRKGRSFYTHFGDVFMGLVVVLCILAYKENSRRHPYSKL